jgi:hypothetical protein
MMRSSASTPESTPSRTSPYSPIHAKQVSSSLLPFSSPPLSGIDVLNNVYWSLQWGIEDAKILKTQPRNNSFTFNTSILVLACIVFGGLGNIWGVILGASILAYLPERIRFISNARQLVFGLVLLVIMNVRPDGLLPRKKREKIKQKEAK